MLIHVKVFPESKRESLKKVKEGKYEIQIREKAQMGEANSRVVELLTHYFKGCKGIKLISGVNRPNKTFEIVEPKDSLFNGV